MGVSTDAKLAWGVDLGEEVPAWLWEEFGVDQNAPDADTYDLTKALNAAGLDLEHHCSDSCTMYVLCVEESVMTAWRGHPQKVTATGLRVGSEWPLLWERVKRAGSPSWLLFSWWC